MITRLQNYMIGNCPADFLPQR